MKKLLLISILAACGGGSKPAAPAEPTTPAEPTPTPMEAAAPPAESQPTPPAEPEPPAPDPKQVAMEAELAAYQAAKPVFEKFCNGCHGTGRGSNAKKLAELDIKEYPFKGKHANAPDIRKSLGIGGGKPDMPKNKPGSVKGDDLALIAAWADAWDAAQAAGAHEAAATPAP